MAASKGAIGKGAIFSLVAGTTPTEIAQVKTVQLSGQKVNYDDITNLDSPTLGTSGVAIKEKLPASAEPGTVDISGIYLPANAGFAALTAAYRSQALTSFTLQLPVVPPQTTTGNLYSFVGRVSEMPNPDVQWDKTLTFKCKIEIEGDLVLTTGS